MRPSAGNERPPGRPVSGFVPGFAAGAPPPAAGASPFGAAAPLGRPFAPPTQQQGPPVAQAAASPRGPLGAPPPAAMGGYRGPPPPQGSFGAGPPPPGLFSAAPPPQGPFGMAPPAQGPFGAAPPPSQGPMGGAPPPQGPFGAAPRPQGPFGAAPPSQGPFGAAPPSQGPFGAAPPPFRPPPSALPQPQSPTGNAMPPPTYVRPPPVQSQPQPVQGYYSGGPNPQFPPVRPSFQQPMQNMPPPTMGPPSSYSNQPAYPTTGPPMGTLQSLVEDFQSLSVSSAPGSLDPGVDVNGLPRPLYGDEEPAKVLEAFPLNCHPRYFRLTTHTIPASQSLVSRWHLPLGAVVHPLAEAPDGEEVPVVNFGSAGVIRCRRCRTYINPYATFADAGRKWRCNLCTLLNDVPGEYFCALDASGRRFDADQRPELSKGTVEFVAPTEYMVRPPMPPSYFFLIDVSVSAVRSGLLEVVAKTIKSCLDDLLGYPRTQIGFLTFDSTLHFHNFKSSLSQPQMMVVADLDDVFLPLPDDLLVNLVDSRRVVESFLDNLPNMFQDNVNVESALGPALKAAFMVMGQIGGKLLVFQSTLPSLGIGRLRLRGDDVRAYGTDKEHILRIPEDPFYKQMAAEFTKNQIAVDIFSLSDKYCDIASLGSLAKYTGGQVYHYPSFQATTHGEKLKHELSRDLTRETAWESVMRIRCGKGVRFTTYHGHFMLRSTDLLALPAVDSDKAFAMQLSLEETLMTTQTVYFQVALLYTSSSGERRIRVHTAAAPVVTDLGEMYRQADTGAIVSVLARIAVENSLSDKLDSVRQQLQLKLVKSLKEYRNLYVVQHRIGGRLIYPESLRYLPLYILALCKSLALRGGYADVSLDERCAAGFSMMILPARRLLNFIYPSLYRLDEVLTVEPDMIDGALKRLPLTLQCLDTAGLYLLDDGFTFLVWLGRMLQPELMNDILGVSLSNFPDLSKIQLRECDNNHSRNFMAVQRALRERDSSCYQLPRVVRQGEQPREGFLLLSNLVEDQMAGTSSYVDWILQIHRQTQSS
ncbi:protein transport protein Sec24-like At3g07100 [Triticum dicoccoides]|uniref:protein transport protein Sec24-like At3g07100 n=1 Tax=Triticum dicoccoides TaxID=85692 RepID=UPI00188E680D|nr:protein transport protein Sec24-like At3g07100 [Triticum dicoccoides]